MTKTQYLLGNGWRPSPTVRAEAAFEHVEHSRVPFAFTKLEHVYVQGLARVPKSAALWIQLREERRRFDRGAAVQLAEHLSRRANAH